MLMVANVCADFWLDTNYRLLHEYSTYRKHTRMQPSVFSDRSRVSEILKILERCKDSRYISFIIARQIDRSFALSSSHLLRQLRLIRVFHAHYRDCVFAFLNRRNVISRTSSNAVLHNLYSRLGKTYFINTEEYYIHGEKTPRE